MYNYMVKHKNDVLVKDNKEGKERVLKENYAFLMESSAIEYERERDCDLIEIGKWLDNKGYAIATPPNSPYRTPLSNAIVSLQDKGILYELKKRWWKDKGGGKCIDESKIVSMELNIESVGGVFVVLGIGVGLGCVFAVLEFIWKSMKIARHQRVCLF
jgi:glutamate receptor, ionotropic, invertebrate